MADLKSRASMDNQWQRHGADRGKGRVERKRHTLEESQRKTAGPGAVEFYAQKNRRIVVEDTPKNIDFVNDGHGGFREAQSIQETIDYGEERLSRVTGKIGDSNTTWITTAAHLPYSLCDEIEDYYPAFDKSGKPKLNADGIQKREPRYVIAEGKEEEAQRYFQCLLDFFAKNICADGQAAIHGGSINLDESRPHAQFIFEELAPDNRSKVYGAMKNMHSLMMGSHRKSRMIHKHDRDGDPLFEQDGSPKMGRENSREKSERYHRELKEFMLAEGFDIEAERDAVRHLRRLNLDDYKDLQSRETDAQGALDTAVIRVAEADAESQLAARQTEEAEIAQAEAAELAETWEREERPALTAEAQDEGRQVGWTEIRDDVERRAREGFRRGYEAGTEKARKMVQCHWDDVEKPRLVTQVEKQAQKRWDEVTKPKLIENFNQEVNEVLMPGMLAQAKADGKQAARQEVEAEMQEQYDASTQEFLEAQQLRQQRQTALERLEAEFDENTRPELIKKAKEDGAERARIEAEKAVEDRRQVDLDAAATDRKEAAEDRATVSHQLEDVQDVLAGLNALAAEMPDAAEISREVMDSASKAYVRAAHDLGLHDRIMARSDLNYSHKHGYFAEAHMQKSKDAYESESWGRSKARLTRSAAEIAAEVEKEKQRGD